ncbi:MAG: AraC family transcriptional regulator [Clostridia bacterium]|nr:AraC family transcriptional regulator [Clostridia bacterium]
MNSKASAKFDIKLAHEMADAFAATSGLKCSVYLTDGRMLCECSYERCGCDVCRMISDATGEIPDCAKVHGDAIEQAERFGGRYIYFCPVGMMFSASPIMIGGSAEGALIGGAVLSTEAAEYLEEDSRVSRITDPAVLEAVTRKLDEISPYQLSRFEKMSLHLFASTVLISDSSREMLVSREKNDQQNSIGEYIYNLKTQDGDKLYPIHTENSLRAAIENGDKAEANRLLNEILGYIFFHSGGNFRIIRARVTELLVILSRAAISGGVSVEQSLRISERHMQQLQYLSTSDDIAYWLAGALNQYIGLVFNMIDIKHRSSIYEAVEYIRENYARRLTLGEVADHVGYSQAYFSMIFNQEMNCSFRTFLNGIRVDKSKQLLLSGKLSIAEISEVTGFPDQSYFCKVFKQQTGVTPDKFRKSNRRIDYEKEYGN